MPMSPDMDPITEDWLIEVGFKWHRFDRQPDKHWLLWLGGAIADRMTCYEDLGIEVAPCRHDQEWFCWLRGDSAGRYHRFIHLRHIDDQRALIRIVEALTGLAWDPDNHFYGHVYSPDGAARIRQDLERADVQIRNANPKWSEIEKDDTRGRALPEHMEFHAEAQTAKQEAKT